MEGGINVTRLLWKKNSQEEDWGFLLIDAGNGFNGYNRTDMLWEIQHECPSSAQFTFNCYHQWANLVIRGGGGGR